MELKNFVARVAGGEIVPSATYYVYVADTMTLATIYDKDGAAIANPGTASASGQIAFAAADGDYNLRVTDGLTLDNQIRVTFADVYRMADLANDSDPTKGAALVGSEGQTVADAIAVSRSYGGAISVPVAAPMVMSDVVVRNRRRKLIVSTVDALRTSGDCDFSDAVAAPSGSLVIGNTVTGEHNAVRDNFFDGADGKFGQVHRLENAKFVYIGRNRYYKQQYHVLQNSGTYANSVSVRDNVSIDGTGDFVLANNDFQAGISYDWSVSGNVVDQTNSTVPFGATECRGIGFASVYGARAVDNSMIACRGDAATHIENIQESSFGFNYYRDNHLDLIFSGKADRFWLYFSSMSGAFVVGETVTGGSSGATATVLFSYGQTGGLRIFLDPVSGTFRTGESVTGGTSGAIGNVKFVDITKTRSTFIGNIFHKSPTCTLPDSTNFGVNNYDLSAQMIGNSWLSEMTFGQNTLAVNGAFAFNVTCAYGVYRGWDTAIGGGATFDTEYVGNRFLCNDKHFNLSALRNSRLSGNVFGAGNSVITSSVGVTYSENKITAGTFTISGGEGNYWLFNRAATAATVNVDPSSFAVFDGKLYQKRNNTHTLSPDTLGIGSAAPGTIATLSKIANNTCASVDYIVAWRNTALSTRGVAKGTLLVEWDGEGVLSVTDVIPSTSAAVKIDGIASGADASIRVTATSAGTTLCTVSAQIVANGVNVIPTNYIDKY